MPCPLTSGTQQPSIFDSSAFEEDNHRMSKSSPPTDTPVCPQCGKTDAVVPIVFGYPTPEGMASAERGEIALAGCVSGDSEPSHWCKRCSREMGEQRLWDDVHEG